MNSSALSQEEETIEDVNESSQASHQPKSSLTRAAQLRKAILKKTQDEEDNNHGLTLTSEELIETSLAEVVTSEAESKESKEDDKSQTETTLSEPSTINDKEEKKLEKEVTEKNKDKDLSSYSIDYSHYHSIDEVIEDLIQKYEFDSKNLGIAYYNFKTKESYYLNENKARHAASTNKVGTAVLYLNLIEEDELDWDIRLPATHQDFEAGDGRITNSPLRSSYTIKELISNLLVYSDNTAWNILIDYYNENFGNYHDDLIENSGVSEQPTDLMRNNNYATPNMLIGYLNLIANNKKYQPIIDYMTAAQEGQRFKLYVDKGMATKYGQYGNGYHDTGIYYEDGQAIYSLVLMTNDIGTVDLFMGDLNLRVNEWYHFQQ